MDKSAGPMDPVLGIVGIYEREESRAIVPSDVPIARMVPSYLPMHVAKLAICVDVVADISYYIECIDALILHVHE